MFSREGSLTSCSASLWCTQNSVDSLRTAHLSFHAASAPQSQGLEDVIRTIQRLDLRATPSSEIGRGEKIGEGETFWVERCNVVGKAVAVKHLKIVNRESGSREFLRRVDSLLLELRIMHHGPLKSHPNILTLVGYGWNMEAGSILPYILVEYSAHGTLRDYLRGSYKYNIRLTDKEMFIADVAAGIHALHTTGIIHGDIKMENVLVFDSNERRGSLMAKICDFGHSILVGEGPNAEKPAVFTGTVRYNAPEVFEQKTRPIARIELKKCDIWAFGLLAWEVLLQGRYHSVENSYGYDTLTYQDCRENPDPADVLSSALRAARDATEGTDDIQRAIFKHLFKRTLDADSRLRIGDLSSLAFMSKWKKTGTVDLSAQLALHTGMAEWSYEIFRFEPNREIFWVHKQHIAQQFLRVCATDTTEEMTKGSAAWQTGLCYATGFGVSVDWKEADKYFLQAMKLGCNVAQRFQKMLYQRGADHNGELYTGIICEMLSLEAIPSAEAQWLNQAGNLDLADQSDDDQHSNKTPTPSITSPPAYIEEVPASRLEAAILRRDCDDILSLHDAIPLPEIPCVEPPLIKGLRTRNWDVVRTLLTCGLLPEIRDKSGRNAFHWLFMLDEDASHFAAQCQTMCENSAGLCALADRPIAAHPQWPLQLEGTPLAHAIAVGSRTTVSALLSLGADPLEEFSLSRSLETWTPIHIAVKYHRPDILKILLDVANMSWDRPPFRTPLGVALCYSTVLERIAMHGRNRKKHLEEAMTLLGPPSALEEVSTAGVTALMRSIESNDLEVTAALLQQNPATAAVRSICPSESNRSIFHYPIHLAAQLASHRDDSRAVEILELITKYDTHALSRVDSNGRKPLHLAATGTSYHAVSFLAEKEPSLLHAVDALGARPLHYCESASVAEYLVSLGAEVNALDSSGQSALCYAVTKELSAVARLLCKLKAATDMGVRVQNNPLHIAIKNGTHEIATTLIAFGASINKLDDVGNTPLHVAARRSPSHMLKLILDNGADALILNDRGQSALHIAAQYDNYDAIDLLSQSKPQLILPAGMETAQSGLPVHQLISQSPLFSCVEKSNTRAVDLMLSRLRKGDAELKDSTGRNALHYATEAGNRYLVEGLIRRGVDLNARTKAGDTALMLAARSRPRGTERPTLCRIFIDRGASLTAENDTGEMVWDIAVESILVETQDDLRSIVELLLLHSDGACRAVTRRKQYAHNLLGGRAREPCGQDLVHFAVNRPDPKLMKALKVRMPAPEFDEAESTELRMKKAEEDGARVRAEEERKRADAIRRRFNETTWAGDDERLPDEMHELPTSMDPPTPEDLMAQLDLLSPVEMPAQAWIPAQRSLDRFQWPS